MDVVGSGSEPTLSPEPWHWSRPRALVEHADAERADALAAALREAGFAVAVCAGPQPGDRCPLACDAGCATATGADVVVSGLGFRSPEVRDALAAVRRYVPAGALLVEAGDEEAARWRPLLDGCGVVGPETPPADVAARARLALAEDADVA